ncbi:hypothetical protein [Parafrankia discariae]|uniref:hypothetical protein n=1 Tax=Parafrankia discariae TaxID=365528 RepID=UPI0003662AFC|nr:hypothetical protein [Parafrankia discariae]
MSADNTSAETVTTLTVHISEPTSREAASSLAEYLEHAAIECDGSDVSVYPDRAPRQYLAWGGGRYQLVDLDRIAEVTLLDRLTGQRAHTGYALLDPTTPGGRPRFRPVKTRPGTETRDGDEVTIAYEVLTVDTEELIQRFTITLPAELWI